MTLSAPPEQTLREPLDRPDDGRRAGVDGPLMPVLAASDVAIPLVAAP
jgi:hypothetical protein